MTIVRKQWRAEVRIRGKPIQYVNGFIRCQPGKHYFFVHVRTFFNFEPQLNDTTHHSIDWSEFPVDNGKDLVLFAGDHFTLIDWLSWEKLACGMRQTSNDSVKPTY